jgi:hypothetical protein
MMTKLDTCCLQKVIIYRQTLVHHITQIQSELKYNTSIQMYFKLETHDLVEALKLDMFCN